MEKYYRITLKIEHQVYYDISEKHISDFEKKHKPDESASIEERIMAFAKSDLHDYQTLSDRYKARDKTCAGAVFHPYCAVPYDSVEITSIEELPF